MYKAGVVQNPEATNPAYHETEGATLGLTALTRYYNNPPAPDAAIASPGGYGGLGFSKRIPKDERVDQMTRIKESGQAGVIAYALIEGAFWIGSIPFAYAAVTLATGAFPDVGTIEGKEALSADAFVFINFARLIVPARIALALSLAPWTDENIVKKFFPPAADDEA